MNQRKVGKVHSNTRSHVRNHGSSRAARDQNSSGSRRPSSIIFSRCGGTRLMAARMIAFQMPFPAFRIFSDAGRIHGAVVEATLDELTPGDVVIRAEYSGVNYKDALAATGAGKILRTFPLIGGIDVSG